MKTPIFRHVLFSAGLILALLGLATLLGLPAPQPAAAETLGVCLVTNNSDSASGSLRALIADPNCTTINFAGDYTITLASQLKLLRRPLTIDGTGHHVTISGNNATRVFWVNGGACTISGDDWLTGQVTLKNLTIANGTAGEGGGLYYYGNLCYGEDSSEQGGDAWQNFRTPGNLNLINVTFLNNTATSIGGGAFLDNHVAASSGGLLGPSAPVLTNVTFSGNSANQSGGALGIRNGGAIMTNLTFADNVTSVWGGTAIWYRYAEYGVIDALGNSLLSLRNSIIWGNTSPDTESTRWILEQSLGTQLGVSYSDIEGGFAGTGNIDVDPHLSTLGDYGGSTDTYALLPGSGVFDATGSNCPTTDQRNVTRSTPNCDLGAFESQGFTLTRGAGSNQSATVYTAFATPLALTVTANDADEPVAGGTVTFTGPASGASTTPASSTATIGAGGGTTLAAVANGTPGGPYAVTASTTGASAVSFTGLTNVCASTVTVRNANDSGLYSLREALTAVCSNGTIGFAANYQITLQSTLDLPAVKNVTIDATPRAVTVSGNNTVRVFSGGAGSTLSLVGFTVANGKTASGGGGVNNQATLNLTNMTFRDNSAANGGGVYNAGSLTTTNCTFSANSATSNGGALYNAASTPVLTNVTFGNNTAASGGGIYNSNSSLTVRNSIVWGGSGGAIVNGGTGSTTVTYSAVQGGYSGTGNTASDPLLSSLGRYGGVLYTFGLLPGSAAIDAANSTYCPTLDERNRPRVNTCDMGAFESQGFFVGEVSGHNQSTAVNTAFPMALLLRVQPELSGDPTVGGKVTITGPSGGASIAPGSFVATLDADSEVEVTLTANGIAGGPYVITATTAGGEAPAVIDRLTNTKGVTTLNLTSSSNPSTYGQNVTLSAAVVTTGTPTGSVQFYIDGAPFGSAVALSGSSAAVSTSSLIIGTHPITATYGGDANFYGSTSNPISQVVNCLSTATVTTASDSGVGSLRYAITYLCPNGTITFSSDTTITLASTLAIAKNLTIDGTGHTVTLSGGGAVRVFSIDEGYSLSLANLTVANGAAPGVGGGGVFSQGTLHLTDVTFRNNSAGNGGGVFNGGYGTLTVSGSTFYGNSVSNGGGAIYNGGALTISNSTFYGNSASANGGALVNAPGSPLLTHVTFSGNTAPTGGGIYNMGTPVIRNSILWGSGALVNDAGGSATVTYSVVQGGYSGTGNTSADPLLASLADYGGETQTQALLPGSSAIDKASTNCATTDQRGITRPTTACDLGAFESRGATLTLVSGNNQSTDVNSAFSAALQVRVNETGGNVLPGATVTFTGPSSGASTNPASFTATAGATGIAAATATANGTTGGPYTVAASVPGATSVSFSLTNLCASVVTVTNANDSGTGSLRAALSSSSVVCPNGTITFAGDYTITLASTLTNAKPVTVDGTGHSVTVSGSNARRVFSVANSYTLSLKGFTVANGAASGANGGGVQNLGTLTLTNMTFRNNAAANGNGGAVYNGGTLTVSNSTFYGNSAGNGGALYGGTGTATLTHVTFAGNTATSGGAIYNGNSSVTVSSSILWGGSGGVIVNAGTGTTSVSNSVIQGGYGGSGNTSADPLLAAFANYGGGTQTLALLPGSSAIDITSTCYASDQRGVTCTHPQGLPICDAGAFESSGFTFGSLSGHPQSATINTAYALPLAVTVTANNAVEPVAGGIVSFTVSKASSGASVSLTGNPRTIPANGRVSVTAAANGIAGQVSVRALASGARATSGEAYAYFTLSNLCTSSVVVTTAADSGTGSLREAIGGVCDGGTVTFDDDYTIELQSRLEIPFQKGLTIDGAGHNVILSGNDAVQVIYVWSNASLGLTRLTVASGAAADGGGVYVASSGESTATDVIFRDNNATHNGGALYSAGTLTVDNCTFYGNTAATSGSGIYGTGSGSTVRNSILWGGTGSAIGGSATVTYSDVQGGYSGTGNLNVDPAFAGAAGSDLRLRHDSPVIDAGNTTGVTIATDLAGNPRVMGAAVDMGAYEVQQATRTVSTGTWLDFGPELCGRIWFTNTGTLPTSVAITLTYEIPFTVTGASLVDRRYQIDARGGAGYQAMVELCYDAEDLTNAGIADAADLLTYRDGALHSPSAVNTADQTVTAFGVTGFSVWTLGDDTSPSAVRLHAPTATGAVPTTAPLGFAAVAVAVCVARKRRRS